MLLADYKNRKGLTLEALAADLGLASTGHASDLVHRRRGMPVGVAKRFAERIDRPWPEVFELNRRSDDPLRKARAA